MAPLFLLTPASLAWSPILAGYMIKLKVDIYALRTSQKEYLSTGDEATPKSRALNVAVRSYGNFVETVPIAMILFTLAEINGAPTRLVHFAYGALVVARIAHVEFGLKGKDALQTGRLVGTLATDALTVGAGLYNGYLAWDSILTALGVRT